MSIHINDPHGSRAILHTAGDPDVVSDSLHI